MTVRENITITDAIEAHRAAYGAFQASAAIEPSLAEEAAARAMAERCRSASDGEFLAALKALLERDSKVFGEPEPGEPFALLAIACRSFFEPEADADTEGGR